MQTPRPLPSSAPSLRVCFASLTACALLLVTLPTYNAQAEEGQEEAKPAASPIVFPGAKLTQVADGLRIADGPAYDGSGVLYIPDVVGQTLYRHFTGSGQTVPAIKDIGRISATYYAHGRLYLSDNANAQIVVLQNSKKVPIVKHDPKTPKSEGGPSRPNDLVVDATGGVYYTLTRQGKVMYQPKGGKVDAPSVAVPDIKTPNGITISPDEKTLYVSAYIPKEVWAYPIKKPGVLGEGKLFASMIKDGDKTTVPGADGMTIDRAGNVFCTGSELIWVWSPSGNLIEKIKTPTRPINAAFGGPDPQHLYITCLPPKKGQEATFEGKPINGSAVYKLKLRINGVSPHPPADNPPPTLEVKGQSSRKSGAKRPSTAIPPSLTSHLNVVYAAPGGRKLLMDIFEPIHVNNETLPRPAVIVVHGGGWLKGDKTKFRALAIALAKRGFVTAAIEYRLGHEARFPAAIHDCNDAVRFLRNNAPRYQIDPRKIGAVGGSAGGHLVGLMATGWDHPKLQAPRPGEPVTSTPASKLQAAIVMAGPMEIATGSVAERSMDGNSNANFWIGGNIKTNNAQYRIADAHGHISKGDPPILFMVGEHDKPERNQPSRDALKKAGVWTDVKVYKDGKHGCWNMLPWFDDMVVDMAAFFNNRLQ